jgi:3-phosphoglycerate kinase
MHIAAAFPLALNADDLDAELIARERKIASEKAAESGKPAEVQAKMVDGAVAKYAKENALLSQLFVMDNKTPIAQVVEAAGKAAGTKIALVDYVRFQLGEGIEKEETDFAAEVAAAAGLKLGQAFAQAHACWRPRDGDPVVGPFRAMRGFLLQRGRLRCEKRKRPLAWLACCV